MVGLPQLGMGVGKILKLGQQGSGIVDKRCKSKGRMTRVGSKAY